ncbi:MAG: flagellar hook-basal body complex protein, partial [Marinobacter sp.]|nr:flagellar hook-basal body complex protein [Marinobacter sp.]
MAFNTGLSGLRAASVDLDVTGNNIANASTVGFKGSKAQFGDLYASGFLSAGTNPIGDGVRVQDVKQSFGQGNISFTDNGLDMAISGDGFFILNNGGEIRYSRAGQFGIDKEGYVTNNQNMRVQGYTADEDGNLSGIRGDLQIQTDNLAPRRTTNLDSDLNLDSREPVLETRVRDIGPLSVGTIQGESFDVQYSDGSPDFNVAIDPAATARQAAATLNDAPGLSASATTTATINGITDSSIASANTTGTFAFSLDINGAPLALDTNGIASLQDLVDSINNSSETAISASIVDDGSGTNVLRVIHNQGETLDYSYGDGTTTTDPAPVLGQVNVTADREVASITST